MYGEIKELILHTLEIGPTRLHILLGVLFYVMCFALTRRPWVSLLLVIALQCGNELLDAREDIRSGTWSRREALTDTLWTVALPLAASICVVTGKALAKLRS
jgi:hypothetical protein